MTYRVKEVFYTLQGEGAHVGRAAVFCRFAGCNLWSGQERHRSIAVCQFCDTDFVGTDGTGGGVFRSAESLALAVAREWKAADQPRSLRYVVCTGGEPLLQLDLLAVEALHGAGFQVAVETNGTRPAPEGIDWLCVSPKAKAELTITAGDELKLVFPQPDAAPEQFQHLDFGRFSLQPMDGPNLVANTQQAIAYCLAHPQWRLSLQTHKVVGIR